MIAFGKELNNDPNSASGNLVTILLIRREDKDSFRLTTSPRRPGRPIERQYLIGRNNGFYCCIEVNGLPVTSAIPRLH